MPRKENIWGFLSRIFYNLDAPPVAQPPVSKALKGSFKYKAPYKVWNGSHVNSVLTIIFQVNLIWPVAALIFLLHLFLNCTSFWDRPKLSMSFLTIPPGLFVKAQILKYGAISPCVIFYQ